MIHLTYYPTLWDFLFFGCARELTILFVRGSPCPIVHGFQHCFILKWSSCLGYRKLWNTCWLIEDTQKETTVADGLKWVITVFILTTALMRLFFWWGEVDGFRGPVSREGWKVIWRLLKWAPEQGWQQEVCFQIRITQASFQAMYLKKNLKSYISTHLLNR